MKYSGQKHSLVILSFVFCLLITSVTEIYSASDSLKYIGHSFVKIKTQQGKVIFIDPYAVNDYSDSADVVLITHEHSDHNDLGRIRQKKTCTVIRPNNSLLNGVYQSFTIGNIKIKSVAAYNSNHPKASSIGFVIEFNNIKIYHAGDTGNITEMADLAADKITYSLIPMDGIYTMSPEVATQSAAAIKAKYDIPMHTMAPPDTYSDAIVARFTSPNKLIVKPGKTIELNATVTDIKKKESSDEMMLNQNFPNPFNPYTIISWQTNVNGHVTLKVYDLLGEEVATLVDEFKKPGSYHSPFLSKASLRDNSQLPSGIYIYSLTTNKGNISRKMILLK